MLKRFGTLGAAITMVALTGGIASASTITFTLDCSVTGLAACGTPSGTPSGPFGTVVLTDDLTNSNWLDISVNLTSPTGRVINKFFLNYNPANFPLPSGYAFAAVGTTVFTAQNSEGNGAYGMAFDLVVNSGGNPFTTTLKLQKSGGPDVDINASDFDFKDADGLLYAAVNYSGAGPTVGALSDGGGASIAADPVPEPASLLLLGIGLIGLGGRRFRIGRQTAR